MVLHLCRHKKIFSSYVQNFLEDSFRMRQDLSEDRRFIINMGGKAPDRRHGKTPFFLAEFCAIASWWAGGNSKEATQEQSHHNKLAESISNLALFIQPHKMDLVS